MAVWLNEFRYAARVLARTPGFTAAAVISLALGIGANTAVFSVALTVLHEPLPVTEPDRLIVAYWRRPEGLRGITQMNSSDYRDPETGQSYASNYSSSTFNALRDAAQPFADVVGFTFIRQGSVSIAGQPTVAGGMLVTGNFFQVIGVPMALGRGIEDGDDRDGADPVVVLSHAFWRRAFGSDPAVLGRTIRVNGQPCVVIGVTAPGYYGVSQGGFFPPTDITVPLSVQSAVLAHWTPASGALSTAESVFWLRAMARLKPGVDAQMVQQALTSAFRQALTAAALPTMTDVGSVQVRLVAGSRGLDSLRSMERPLQILAGIVGLVFLIACVNLASLVLARGVARQQELWIRLALGAGRLRAIRQNFAESVLLAAAGGAIGIALATWGAPVLVVMLAENSPAAVNISIDAPMIAIAAVVAFIAALLFGLVPAIRLAGNTSRFVRPTGIGSGSPRLTVGRALIAIQIAVSLPLIVGATLFLRTLHNLASVDLGFDPRGLIVFRVDPPLSGYTPERLQVYFSRLLERIAAVPGVQSAALSENGLIAGIVSNSQMSVEGAEPVSILFNHVSPEFFDTMRIPLVAGRSFGIQDHRLAPSVAVVNEAAARAHFGGSAIGKRLTMRGFGRQVEFQVVGVVRDSRYSTLKSAMRPTVFFAHEQSWFPLRGMSVAVRTSASGGVAERVRAAAAEVDRDIPLAAMKTQLDQIDETISRERVFSALLAFFGGFAMLLACVGLHGVTSYAVARRTSEIGIRMALGAQRSSVIWLVLRQVVVLAIIGLLVGIPATVAAVRTVRAWLFGVEPTDPVSLIAGSAALTVVALASGFIPARRASRLDPLVALKADQ
jgi:predicted permease